jgi:hypothetical protein
VIKHSLFSGKSPSGEQLINIITPGNDFVKTAGIHPEIQAYKQNLSPEPNKTYLHILALGAGEYYGSNLNHDYFPWDGLVHDHTRVPHKYVHGYKTFLNAHAFAHHQNNDPTKAYGDVLVSVLNEKMKRVELIAVVDHAKCKALGGEKILEKLIEGKDMATSMGCRIPYDVCMICGNVAPTRREYCECMLKRAGQILPDGRKVCVSNPFPRFFDISFVYIGADRTSHVLEKIATVVDMGAHTGLTKTASVTPMISPPKVKIAAEEKLSEIFKEIDGYPLGQAVNLLHENECSMPEEEIQRIAETPNLPHALSNLAGNGVIVSPREFTRIIVIRGGAPRHTPLHVEPELNHDVDDDFLRKMIQFGATPMRHSPLLESRSYLAPYFFRRLISPTKLANKEVRTKVAMPDISRLYNAYRYGVLYNMDKYAEIACGCDPSEELSSEDMQVVSALSSIPLMYAMHSYWGKSPEENKLFLRDFLLHSPVVSSALLSAGNGMTVQQLLAKYPIEKIMQWIH